MENQKPKTTATIRICIDVTHVMHEIEYDL